MRAPLGTLLLLALTVCARAHTNDGDPSCNGEGFDATLGQPESVCDGSGDPGRCAKRLVRMLVRCQQKIDGCKPNDRDCLDGAVERKDALFQFALANPGIRKASLDFYHKTGGHEDTLLANMGMPDVSADGSSASGGANAARAGVPTRRGKSGATGDDGGGGPRDSAGAIEAAAKALASGDSAGALKLLDGVLARNGNDSAALALRAQARLAQGDRAGALADSERAFQLDPNDRESGALASQLRGLLKAQGKVGGAKADFGGDRAADGAGGGAGGPRLAGAGAAPGAPTRAGGGEAFAGIGAGESTALPAVRNLLQHADELMKIGDWSGAILLVRQALDSDPKNGAAWDTLAELSNRADNPDGAIAAAEAALKLNPDDPRALRAKAYAEYQKGDYAAALADAARATRLDPGNGMGFLYKAMAEEKLGDAASALADYQTAVRLDPTLKPLAAEALKRLGGGAAGGRGLPIPRAALRGGAIALSTLLIVLGLMGTATGRRAVTNAVRAVTGRGAAVAATARPATLSVGEVVGGHYRVTRELGRGGMGVVYEALDETLQRRVAIKRLLSEWRGADEDRDRFLREARLVAQLKHPNLAEIHAVIDEGDPLLVFEFIDGETLDRVLARSGRLSPSETRRVLAGVCAALERAHAQRVVHRDLKPSNVMLAKDGTVKVMDLGIAHQARGDAATRTTVSGTPHYMPPEQGVGSVSKASDFYALGVVTYELLTGKRPFNGPDFFGPKVERDFAPASTLVGSLPPGVDAFFAKVLEPDATKRVSTAAEFLAAYDAAFAVTPRAA